MSVTISGSGQIVKQVQSVFKSDTFSTTAYNTTWADVTGLSVSITPSNSANKILVMASFQMQSSTATSAIYARMLRNGTAISVGDTAGSRVPASAAANFGAVYNSVGNSILFLDSPATTSSVTYKLQMTNGSNGQTAYLNRTGDDGDDVNRSRTPASIIVMEIAYA
jgi:hypothetical protein